MNKAKTFLLFVLVFTASVMAQKKISPLVRSVVTDFVRYNKAIYPEKIYLQTDKPYYSAGEQIWFKGFLVDGIDHKPVSLSNYIYVELVSKSDTAVQRVKVRKANDFAGYFKLPATMPEGNYMLRAYTNAMRGSGEDFFSKKNIYIGNTIDDDVNCTISYSQPQNGKVIASIQFKNKNKYPITGKTVVSKVTSAPNVRKSFQSLTNGEGKVSVAIPLDNLTAKKSVEISVNDPSLKIKRTFFCPPFTQDFDVQFFPEGGSLIENIPQSVAFKAIGSDGLSVEVSGTVYNSKNEEQVEFASAYKGMGKLLLSAEPGQTYYAKVKTASGLEKRVELPRAVSQGVTIQMGQNHSKIVYQIINQTNLPLQSLYLLVHCRGKVLVMRQLDSLSVTGLFNTAELPNGIISFSVIDSLKNHLCERVAFCKNNLMPQVSMTSNKPVYGRREKVDLTFKVLNKEGDSAAGNYAISVTDNKTVALDTLSDNILSSLLLSSDIKGYIEDPAYYFSGNTPQVTEALDLLMMTQGWKRFNTADILKGKFKTPEYYIEVGQTLSGKVVNLIGKPSKNADIFVFAPTIRGMNFTKSDSLGNYLLQGIEFPDSTRFILKANRKKGLPGIEIIPDKESFPAAHLFIPDMQTRIKAQLAEYLDVNKEKYYLEGGMRVYNLGEVTVEGKRKSTVDQYPNVPTSMADYTLSGERLAEQAGMTIFDLLVSVPGVQVNGENVSIRNSPNEPTYYLDGVKQFDKDQVSYLTALDIESISVFKGASTAMFGMDGGSGVISIILKKGYERKTEASPSIGVSSPLGFQKRMEFYVPKYDVDSVRNSKADDLRTTIYWNPGVKTDSTGMVKVSFFTADKVNDYNVILEGITQNGEICRYRGELRRERY
ncbi:TonB-dependent receptor plug domain-containing protein [Parabacteroides sp. FAFU027]|uniref:TonB-dependent receptor plug domain-containing protein n=1 Tax=Parabacteroides sp. FAFU027 TaxID=2922715 RepID=UPI001FAFCF52|nr:TonB-dependent receptor plug domain-containing protein [Parabacteroides sp. FAFU027]